MRTTVGLAILLLAVLTAASAAEPPDSLYKLLTRQREPCCADFIYNGQKLIPRFYTENKPDSIRLVIDFVNSRCGIDQFRSFELLTSIERKELSDNWCDTAIANDLLSPRYFYYSRRTIFDFIVRTGGQSSSYQDCASVEADYGEFIRSFAEGLLPNTRPGSAANLMCQYYVLGRDTILTQLRNNVFSGTCYQTGYRLKTDSLLTALRNFRYHCALAGGIWVPTGAAHTLGDKMELGFLIGDRWRGFGIDIASFIRFFDATHAYTYRKPDRFVTTRKFMGWYLGLEPSLEVRQTRHTSSEISVGIGYDAIGSTRNDEDHKWSANSVSFNAGITHRIFIDRYRNRYFGLRLRFNSVKYGTNGGSDLSGNSVTIHLLYGSLSNAMPTDDLKQLGYYK